MLELKLKPDKNRWKWEIVVSNYVSGHQKLRELIETKNPDDIIKLLKSKNII